MAALREASKAGKQEWMSRVKRAVESSPLASNTLFGLILMGLEKFVELEFRCPCDPKWNALYGALYFVFPALAAFILMMTVQEWKCACTVVHAFCTCMVPVMMWLILLFFDGHYYACAKTYWSGRYVFVDRAAPVKWCEPANVTSAQGLLIETERWFFHSQRIGLGLAAGSVVVFFILKCIPREQTSLITKEEYPLNTPPGEEHQSDTP